MKVSHFICCIFLLTAEGFCPETVQSNIAERAEKELHGTLMMYIQHRLVKGTQIATSLIHLLSKEYASLLKRLDTRLRLLHDLLMYPAGGDYTYTCIAITVMTKVNLNVMYAPVLTLAVRMNRANRVMAE